MPSPGQGQVDPQVQLVQRLFIAHANALRALIHAALPDWAMSMDLLQETFLTVTAKAADFAEGSNFLAWAGTIARYKALNARRTAKVPSLSAETIDALCAHDAARPADPRLDLIRPCVEQLPTTMRRMVDRYYVDSETPSAIARAIGWSVEAVYVALSRARAAVRKCVQQKLAVEDGGQNQKEGRR